MNQPLISVILPAYNAMQTIRESIESIISQTYSCWELIVINDGSKDDTLALASSFTDNRIKVVSNEGNKGLIYTLNRGIQLSRGKYIARMDSDDISLPDRFKVQVDYLESHPLCIVCGSFVRTFSGKNKKGRMLKYETDDEKVSRSLAFSCCFAHPSVMMRADVIKASNIRYDENFPYAEDYKFWIDIMHLGRYHNIPKVLLKYRISGTQMSQSKEKSELIIKKCRWLYLNKYLGAEEASLIKASPISIDTIKHIKSLDVNTYFIVKTLYLSLDRYTMRELFYYVISFDVIKYDIRLFLQIMKRLIKGKNSVLF